MDGDTYESLRARGYSHGFAGRYPRRVSERQRPCQDARMADEIVWEEPPEHAVMPPARGQYRDFAQALRQNKDKWAILPGDRKSPDSAKNTAQNVRRGIMKDFTKGEFEVAVDGKKIYVRWVGAQNKAAQQAAEEADTSATEAQTADAADDDEHETHDSKKVRAWGRANGYDLPDRGRMPQAVVEAYRKAHAVYDRQPDAGAGEQEAGMEPPRVAVPEQV